MSYKKIYVPSHPNAMKCGCVYEHRLIMEDLLGRYLTPEEQVHHRDENPSNNDPDNLFLCPTQKDHSLEHAYDDDFMIELLIRYCDLYGSFPTKKQCDGHPEMPHSSTYIRHFGSWSESKRIAQNRLHLINDEGEMECYIGSY